VLLNALALEGCTQQSMLSACAQANGTAGGIVKIAGQCAIHVRTAFV
jgi:hypothetical protein